MIKKGLRAHLHDGALELPARSIDKPQRVINALSSLGSNGASLEMHSQEATDEQLQRAHAPQYIQGLKEQCSQAHGVRLDPELVLDERTFHAASCAAGAMIHAAMRPHHANNSIQVCLSRPGSHHAGPDYALGFCVINNLAVAAHELLHSNQASKVAILDFDAHHGNGTEEIFLDDERVLTISIHQYPFFPGSGDESVTGKGGTNFNIPLSEGAGDDHGRQAFARACLAIERFQPDVILVEAGVDGHIDDWTTNLCYTTSTFHAFGSMLNGVRELTHSHVVIEMGGGYTDKAVREGFTAFLGGLV